MRKLKLGLIAGAVILILAEFAIIDYSTLASAKNFAAYLMIPGLMYSIFSLIVSIRHDKQQQANPAGKHS